MEERIAYLDHFLGGHSTNEGSDKVDLCAREPAHFSNQVLGQGCSVQTHVTQHRDSSQLQPRNILINLTSEPSALSVL